MRGSKYGGVCAERGAGPMRWWEDTADGWAGGCAGSRGGGGGACEETRKRPWSGGIRRTFFRERNGRALIISGDSRIEHAVSPGDTASPLALLPSGLSDLPVLRPPAAERSHCPRAAPRCPAHSARRNTATPKISQLHAISSIPYSQPPTAHLASLQIWCSSMHPR